MFYVQKHFFVSNIVLYKNDEYILQRSYSAIDHGAQETAVTEEKTKEFPS
jgi:hypothetical protein